MEVLRTIAICAVRFIRRLFPLAMLLILSLSIYRYLAPPHIPLTKSASPADVRMIKHAMGKTAVPLHPQRVVSLDEYFTEVAISLGVELKGYPKADLQPGWRRSDVVDVGLPLNIEKLLTLNPDLLLSTFFASPENYSLLSHIAPTVMFKMKVNPEWKQLFIELAKALNQTKKVNKIVKNYNQRIACFKAKTGRKLRETKVSVVHILPGKIIIRTQDSFSGSILEELGLDRPLSQKPSATPNFSKIFGNSSWYFISPELLSLIDADVLFVVTSNFSNTADVQLAQDQLMPQPLWSKLKVVQQGKVHVVGQYWLLGSYLSANQVLDDVFKFLLNH